MAAGRRVKGRIPADKWRKHMHWFSLTRFHAEIVSNDTDVSRRLPDLILLAPERVMFSNCVICLDFKSLLSSQCLGIKLSVF